MSVDETIRCRAQLEDDCYDGSPMSRQLGHEEGEAEPFSCLMAEDNTYRTDGPYAHTIVCDACYVRLIPLTPSSVDHQRERIFARREVVSSATGERIKVDVDVTDEHVAEVERLQEENARLRAMLATTAPCGCAARCGDDGDIDGPGVCKGLPNG